MPKYGLTDFQILSQAESLRANTLLAGILQDLQDTHFDRWLASAPKDVDARERCHAHFMAVSELRQEISNSIAELKPVIPETEKEIN